MRNLNGIKWIFTLALISSAATADLIIDGQQIPGTDISSISIGPLTGDISVATIPGYTVTINTGPPPPNPVALTLTASPSTITEGESTTLSWTTSNAASCTASNGTGGWSALTIAIPNGSAPITIAAAGNYTFTMTCLGVDGDSIVRNAAVTANPVSVPGTCDAPTLSGNEVDWIVYWLVGFPQPGYDNRNATIPRNGYLSIKFNTGSIVDDGKLSSLESTATTGVRFGAISECPGDFNVAPQCDHYWGLGGGIRWATNGRSGACQLLPNTDYYFNVTFTDGVSGSTTTCDSSPCITVLQHVNQ